MRPYFLQPRSGPLAQQPISYSLTQIGKIYQFPPPSEAPVTVGVFSFGGGLRGTLAGGFLINGDPQQHWISLGISAKNHPKIIVVPVNGATFSTRPNPDDIATIENTIDIETIGALCPTSKLTIILYIAKPNDDFPVVLAAAQRPITIGGISYTPSIISCSWGAPESAYDSATLNANNALFRAIAAKGITITAASGDSGSSADGSGRPIADFPSSSPHVVACGGTTLRCPSGIYDGSTIETTWSGSGGGFASQFSKPDYQSDLVGSKRATPDIALVADPKTGVRYTIGGAPNKVVGGTSIVSPAIAAFAAAINLKQILTPLLYSFPPTFFNDITLGSNGEYHAKIRHDNCTGLGSIVGSMVAARLTVPIPVQSVTLTGAPSIQVGNSTQLIATVQPPTATTKAISFSSSNPGVATVSPSGVARGVAGGSATITVTTIDGSYTSSLTLSVTVPPVIRITSLTFPANRYSLAAGTKIMVKPKILPPNAANKEIRFTSSNPDIATVDPATGTVTGVITGNGTAMITATSVDGGVTGTTAVVVTSTRVASITLAPIGAAIKVGASFGIRATVKGANNKPASNSAVTWSVNQPTVVSVSNGSVRGLKAGTAVVTATTVEGGKTDRCTITVRPA
jgi:uncharacterized protein YjdB